MKSHPVILGLFIMLSLCCSMTQAVSAAVDQELSALIKRGEYLSRIAGCNDCHTAGYAQAAGKIPKDQWLMGDHLGWQGPWGTTYPTNLRLSINALSEKEWLNFAKTAQSRPPMPWFGLREMQEQDLKAIYHFVKSLGAAGQPAPAYLPPGQPAQGPVVTFPSLPPTQP
jgi:mono/diheme cytochrome c family protein